MNGIEKITDRIAVDTDSEVKALLEQAEQQASDILADYKAREETDYVQALEKGKADAADRIERLGSVAQLEARKRLLGARQEILEETFDAAQKQLLDMPEKDYIHLLAQLAVEGSSTGSEALVLSVTDRSRYGKRVVAAANEMLEAAGKNASMTLSEESREFTGGLYIQNGKIETNCTFPAIIRTLREEMASEVARVLFD